MQEQRTKEKRETAELRRARRAVKRKPGKAETWEALEQSAKRAGATADVAEARLAFARQAEEEGRLLGALWAQLQAARVGADVGEARARVLRQLGKALAATVLSAGLLIASAPRQNLWPLGLVALVPLYLTVRDMRPWAAFGYAWLASLGLNLYAYAWTLATLDRFAAMTGWKALGVLGAMCAYQATALAASFAVAALLLRRARVPWVLSAPLLIAITEGLLPQVFPSNLGTVVWRAWPLLQVAEVGGPPAVSALVVAVNVLLGDFAAAALRRRTVERATRVGAYVVVGIIAAGLVRAGQVALQRKHAPHLKVALLQPNFGIMSVQERQQHGQEYVDLLRTQTDLAGSRGAQLVVWPESSFPFLFDRQLEREYAPGHPWSFRSSYRGDVLVGALTHTFGGSSVYNSALLIAGDGRVAGRYDKQSLMPFGEYIPMSDRYPDWAKDLRKRLPESPDIVPGTEATILESGPLRVAPMICYEDILPETTQRIAEQSARANLLVTLVNHAWFGASLAPSESLALATLRSVELRRDLVRAANTGVSSIGDALGRVQLEGPLVEVTPSTKLAPQVLEGDVALMEGFALGPYTMPWFSPLCGLVLGGAAGLAAARGRRRRAAGG